MAGRGRTTFEKRRKEMARKEKQRLKEERRAERKASSPGGLPPIEPLEPEPDSLYQPDLGPDSDSESEKGQQ